MPTNSNSEPATTSEKSWSQLERRPRLLALRPMENPSCPRTTPLPPSITTHTRPHPRYVKRPWLGKATSHRGNRTKPSAVIQYNHSLDHSGLLSLTHPLIPTTSSILTHHCTLPSRLARLHPMFRPIPHNGILPPSLTPRSTHHHWRLKAPSQNQHSLEHRQKTLDDWLANTAPPAPNRHENSIYTSEHSDPYPHHQEQPDPPRPRSLSSELQNSLQRQQLPYRIMQWNIHGHGSRDKWWEKNTYLKSKSPRRHSPQRVVQCQVISTQLPCPPSTTNLNFD